MQDRTRTTTRTSAARVAFLFVVAALALQASPAWAMPAAGSKARAGHFLTGVAARHAIERHAGRAARIGSASASAFAPGGSAASLVVRALERPLELVALTLAGGTGFTPATAPAASRPLRL